MGYLDLLYEFNHTRPTELERRQALLKELLAEFGEGSSIPSMATGADIICTWEKGSM